MTGGALTLHYFPIRGLAEQIRMTLAEADATCAFIPTLFVVADDVIDVRVDR